jgi:CHAT domain-containing protein
VRQFREDIRTTNKDVSSAGKALYNRLIQPLAGEIKGTTLTVVPHAILHYLPFSALSDGQKYLIDSYNVRIMPSASTLLYLKTAKLNKQGKLLALGNPDLGQSKYDLPSAQTEAIQVAKMFPLSRSLVRQEASKSAVREFGDGFSILHIAAHGVFDSDKPLQSGLLLAKGKEADGRLTVSDLYSMNLNMDLVTLSACETGLSKVASGDDLVGLTRGFLYAGSRSIITTLWEVDDAATAELMLHFYQNLDKHGKLEALRMAQIHTRKKFPHPFFWAAFQVTGAG